MKIRNTNIKLKIKKNMLKKQLKESPHLTPEIKQTTNRKTLLLKTRTLTLTDPNYKTKRRNEENERSSILSRPSIELKPKRVKSIHLKEPRQSSHKSEPKGQKEARKTKNFFPTEKKR